jgi:3-dehydroquinate dehydratase/shikimate dehydrogenase
VHAAQGRSPAELAGARALVIGTGGAARAAAWAVAGAGGAVAVAGRRPERARALAGELGCRSVDWDDVPGEAYDVLVHCTPVGSAGAAPGALPFPEEWLRPGTLVLDAVYAPIRTPLLLAALRRGCTPVPGGEWFVRQAALQFRLFTNGEPNEDLMRKAFEHAHRESAEPAHAPPPG